MPDTDGSTRRSSAPGAASSRPAACSGTGWNGSCSSDAGIPHAYYEILVRLSEAPDRTLRMSQFASTSLSSRSRLSHAVARIEESGWVRRLPYPDDRRGALAQLTDEGMARLEAAAPAHVEQVRSLLFDPLTRDQLAALREISDRLAAHLSDTPSWPVVPDEPACGDEADATTR